MRIFTFLLLLLALNLNAQLDLNMDLISIVEAPEGSNDVWGFEHSNGTEYAILGTRANTKIYSLANPATPIEKAVIQGPFTTWRDMKNFNDYIYVTTDGAEAGLTIIDMTDPEDITSTIWDPSLWIANTPDSLKTCHNIFIDDEGYGYLAGCNIANRGVIILDLFTDPLSPTMVGYANLSYSHDVYTKGNRMYTSEIYEGWFGVYDISDKTNPIRIATQQTGTNFTHNAWTSDDENYIFTTDEKADAYLEAYDISDLSDIQQVDTYRPLVSEGNGVIPHNTHYLDGFLITSWYTDGVVVVDANKPDNLVKVAGYDTWLGADGGFNGCWGAYPYLPSGLLLASDRTNGLVVLSPSYQRACYLEGTVTSEGTGAVINGATISILSTSQLAEAGSNAAGNYKTGIADSGTYEVEVSHPAYETLTTSVQLINGEVTILDAQLIKPNAMVYTGSVVRDMDDQIIPNAMVRVIYPDGTVENTIADESGNALLELQEGVYEIYASTWGYKIGHYQLDTATDPQIQIRLEQGYRDEFYFDHGWEFSGDADEGFFTIGVPEELIIGDNIFNIDLDNQEDIGTEALLTGDGSFHPVHLDYVKNGSTTAVSPVMDLSQYDYPIIKFDLFYVHRGSTELGPYSLDIEIRRETDHRVITKIDTSNTEWISVELHPKQVFWDLSNVQIAYPVFNDINGIITEVAIDVFEVVEGTPSDIQDFVDTELLIFPNPSFDEFNVSLESEEFDNYLLTNINGQLIQTEKIDGLNFSIDSGQLNPGVYFLQLKSDQSLSKSYKLIKQ